jgi:hypothetical protein
MKASDNQIRADNQQERLHDIPTELGHYLAGFADGEGSFNVSVVRRQSDYQTGWKIVASFNISQRDSQIPLLFQQTLGCGTIRFRKDGVCYFEIRRLTDLDNYVREFFVRFPLRSERQAKRLEQLLSIVAIMAAKAHHSNEGLEQILGIRELMISNRKRKYQRTDVMQNPQRLHARLT